MNKPAVFEVNADIRLVLLVGMTIKPFTAVIVALS
jgi:hypothetical protein